EKLEKVKESYAATEKKLKENAATQGELVSRLTAERDEALSSLEVLKEEKAVLEGDVSALGLSVVAQYEDGFNFALEQVRLVFPDL
ncbi:hypothetical protein A2U01_0086833, partial [Trifolium medium]|nr:hypothetical protein [Trifolium medium]